MRALSDLMNLEGRVALVTGGAGHLGKAFAETLVEAGASVAIVDREQSACDERASELSASGRAAIGIAADLAVEREAREAVHRVLSRLGRLDILVNNAAFTGDSGLEGYAVPFGRQTVDAWDAALRVNLTAAFVLSHAARDALETSTHGSIINIASIYGTLGPDLRLYEGTSMGNPAAYAASKGGLVQLTRHLSTVLAPKVRVNAICPGGIKRGQPASFVEQYESRTPLKRMAVEEDFKGVLSFLASDASAYVTGQALMVDGGWSAW